MLLLGVFQVYQGCFKEIVSRMLQSVSGVIIASISIKFQGVLCVFQG